MDITPNYSALIDAMTAVRPVWRHKVCLDRRLVANVREASDALEQATQERDALEGTVNPPRRKFGQVSAVETAKKNLEAAIAERDAASIVFVLSPPTAEEEYAALKASGLGDQVAAWQAWSITLSAAWQRTENPEGETLAFLDRDRYQRALSALTSIELMSAHSHLMAIATEPDFS